MFNAQPTGMVISRRSIQLESGMPGFDSRFPGRVIPVTSKLVFMLPPCQAPDIIGSALGLVGQVGWNWLARSQRLL